MSEDKTVEPRSEHGAPLSYLATGLQATIGLVDLARLEQLYPTDVDLEEVQSLRATLRTALDLAISQPEFASFREDLKSTGVKLDDLLSSGTLIGLLAMRAPSLDVQGHAPDEISAALSKVTRELAPSALPHVRRANERIIEIKLHDCRIPQPPDDATYRDPRRAVQLIEEYWGRLRQIALFQSQANVGFVPHPLLPAILDLADRINRVRQLFLALDTAALGVVEDIKDLLLDEPGALSVAEEHTHAQVTSVDRWIVETRLRIGRKTFQLTHAESSFLDSIDAAIAQWKERSSKAWRRMLARADAVAKRSKSSGADNEGVPALLSVSSAQELRALCAAGEDQLHEFKEAGVEFKKLSREIAAMLNTRQGGMILYGVADDGSIRGVRPDLRKQDFDQSLQNSIANTIKPAATVNLDSIDVDDKRVFVIIVPPWNRRDVYQHDGRVLLRKGTNVFPADPEEIRTLHAQRHVV